MKIALFGGSFDPVHNVHLEIAKKIVNEKITDEVWFIPCSNHAFDKKLLVANDRINMIKLAIKDDNRLKICLKETSSKEKSYTSETIKSLINDNPNDDFYWIIGSDNLEKIDLWHDFQYLKNNVKFILVKRPGYEVINTHGIKIYYVVCEEFDISSTMIRERIKSKISIIGLVNKDVEKYIINNGLYK